MALSYNLMMLFSTLMNLRRLWLVVFLAFSLSACTILPGMTARYAKPAVVIETPEEPANQSYTLVKVTPKLVKDMRQEEIASGKKAVGVGVFANPPKTVYRLGPQDGLRIFVWGHPDLTPTVASVSSNNLSSTPAGRVINDRGDIFFPMVGNIKAAGLTVSEFREALTKQLSKFIKDPQVEVDVSGFRSQKIFIAGEVRSQGAVPITDVTMRLTDAISLAGGFTQEADIYNVVLTRGKQSAQIDLDRLYYGGDTSSNLILRNGDILTVPDRQSRKVFVLGELGGAAGINQSRSYVMRRGRMSLSEVIGDAGGLNPFSAAAGKVFLMRPDSNGEPSIYQLDASNPESLIMAEQFTVRPRDVVFVSPTDITELGRFIGQFFPLTSATQSVTNTPF
jgi:polysaccharide export outer membrane protein